MVIDNVRLCVDSVEKNRIDKIHLYILNPIEAVTARREEEAEKQ